MTKKTGLKLERHIELGKELHRLRERLQEIGVELSMVYPKKLSDKVHLVVAGIDNLRSDLDSRVCEENRDLEGMTMVYYGRPGETRSEGR